MISDRSAQLIEDRLREAAGTWQYDADVRYMHSVAFAEFRAYRQHATAAAVAADEPDPVAEQHRVNERTVEQTVLRHASAILNITARCRPIAGEAWPSIDVADAQWHAMRLQALQAVPVDVAARLIREHARLTQEREADHG